MPIATVQTQLILRPTGAVSEDWITNSMHFRLQWSDDIEDSLDQLQAGMVALYAELFAEMGGLSNGGHTLKVINLDDPPPRVPIREAPFSVLVLPSSNQLPREVAICASFQAEQVSGLPQASRKNRIYIGPLATDTVNAATGMIASGSMTAIRTAMANFAIASRSSGAVWTWVVYSPKNGTWAVVNDGWVDNAFDTQRRRGQVASTRSTWTEPAEN